MKKYVKIILFLGILLIIAGCSKEKSTINAKLPKEDVAFTWLGERTKNFGSSNYPVELSEIDKVMDDKYQIKFSSLINDSNELVNKEFSGNNIAINDSFEIAASEEKLLFSGNKLFENQQNNIIARVKMSTEYIYMPSVKKAKLSNQDIEIRTVIKDKKYPGKDFNAFIKPIIEMMKLPDSNKASKLFEKKVEGEKKAIAGQTIKLYDNRDEGKQEGTFGKYLLVQFDSEGIPMNIFLGTSDYRY
ncbi:hypothetical protein JZO66_06140 [Enterococcus sp. DIV0242_7C1]|uniref:Lipoprotein n=1 Tax=Candidatus Enterococcus dunnyi TaxID=1834192 RepID=A0A200J147_9ENTE|nr:MULTISPECIES: hypothetical protein [unclassified Enterococcus]MBO0470116.1 hypothetical protein [Enterococcus sp. DIV0242_7C1]OUZ30569.1 hypothetical protein A5889_002857 [Enterococcus sp. 9D6_DIV0238]